MTSIEIEPILGAVAVRLVRGRPEGVAVGVPNLDADAGAGPIARAVPDAAPAGYLVSAFPGRCGQHLRRRVQLAAPIQALPPEVCDAVVRVVVGCGGR